MLYLYKGSNPNMPKGLYGVERFTETSMIVVPPQGEKLEISKSVFNLVFTEWSSSKNVSFATWHNPKGNINSDGTYVPAGYVMSPDGEYIDPKRPLDW